jgi:hypothetical protein
MSENFDIDALLEVEFDDTITVVFREESGDIPKLPPLIVKIPPARVRANIIKKATRMSGEEIEPDFAAMGMLLIDYVEGWEHDQPFVKAKLKKLFQKYTTYLIDFGSAAANILVDIENKMKEKALADKKKLHSAVNGSNG